ncbi:hypothetical protein F0562_033319 [Nyssa sinensis]|uniref:MPN domain-containing protein n=1 Tax=Nyssa sinensis TaxID=561372 RepID=A0A5J5ASA6_9ASTE|nr:hypothetical protein F0562_033319 [Nyssa sinensis]
MKERNRMDILNSTNDMGVTDHKLPLVFLSNQPNKQEKVYIEEGNAAILHKTLDRYCSTDNEENVRSASSVDSGTSGFQLESLRSISFTAASYCWQIDVRTVTRFPPPAISCIHAAPHVAEVSRITVADSVHGCSSSSCNELAASKVLKDVHIKERTFYVTTMIIPKQESTSSSCQTLNEEEIFAIQNEQSLIPVGWIHTHPSQSCFMSSIDLHTQYSYQVMVPEAIAIVMAPTDKSRGYGIFRLSDPSGMSILKECREKGFHPHGEPADGSSIYEQCSNIYINPNLRFEICDLR